MTQITAALFEIYTIFMVLLVPIDHLYQNHKLQNVWIQLFQIFLDPAFFESMVQHFLERGQEMAVLMLTIPGADCFTTGYRITAIVRFIFDIKY